MSSVSTGLTNLIVEYEGSIVFDLLQNGNLQRCDSVRDIKRAIQASHDLSMSIQLLALENILLPENLRIEDLGFKFNSAISNESDNTNKLNRPLKLSLSRSKGQANLKVNIISNKSEPINLNLVVHGSISIFQLREQILEKLPEE